MNATDSRAANRLDGYFQISERGSTLSREFRGGLATFFTMAYIVVLNPLILVNSKDKEGQLIGDAAAIPANIDPTITKIAAATAFVAGLLTILMGVAGRVPFAMATGLGLNAFVAVNVAAEMSWEDAMGLVVLEGLVIAVLVLTGFRTAVFHAIPDQLKIATSVGIGLFIALIGFVDAGFVRKPADQINQQGELVHGVIPLELGYQSRLVGWPTVVFVVGVLLTAVLIARKVKGAILLGIVSTTILAIVVEAIGNIGPSVAPGQKPNPAGWQLNTPEKPDDWFDASPDLGLLGEFSLFGGFDGGGTIAVTALLFVFTMMITDFFDTMGTIVGVGRQANLVREDGTLPRTGTILFVDSVGAAAGGAGSVSSNTTYIESAAGVGEGARTGLASVVTGLLFLVAMFFTPLVTVVPHEAAAPALVVVGFLMMTQIRGIDFSDYEIGIPAFLTIALMPFSYSIANGIGAGFISYVVIKVAKGKWRDVHPLLWLVAALFMVYFAIDPLSDLLGVD